METELVNLRRLNAQVLKTREHLFSLFEIGELDKSEISERLIGNRQ